jgi:hypothetical protein
MCYRYCFSQRRVTPTSATLSSPRRLLWLPGVFPVPLPHDPDAISFGSTEPRSSLDALAAKMLTALLNSPAASVQGRLLGVEEEIRGMLVEACRTCYGRCE